MQGPKKRSNNRAETLLDAAAHHFAAHGYHGTTIRDISKAVGMLPGSIYYHVNSKAQLLLEVYEEGVRRITQRVTDATNNETDPWAKLEAAIGAHLETMLERGDYARVMLSVLPGEVPKFASDLVELRNRYEEIFRELVDDLPLAPGADPSMLRLMLLGAMNHAQVWYRPGRSTPAEIAHQFVGLLRASKGGNSAQEDD